MPWYILTVFISLHCLVCTGFDVMSKFKVSLRGFNAQLSADTVCKEVLMGAISGAMSASSSHSDHPPNSGRLLADTWWMPDQHDVFQYLKVDFSGLAVVRKSAVKGSGNSTAAGARVIAYYLHHSFDGDIWYPVLEKENARLFVGNLNNSEVTSESSFPPFLARHVKFVPQHWQEKIALRVELYGCRSSGMDVAMGMEFKAIPDAAISATSSESSTFQPSNARLHQNNGGGGWCAKSDLADQPQYLQVLLDREWALIAVATQGIQSMQSWVSEYYLSTSLDRQIWVFAHDFNGKKLLKGKRDSAENVVIHHLPMFTWITALRIHPHSWERRICLRVELYGMDSRGSSNDTENNWCGAHGELRGPDAKPVKTCFCSPGYEGDGFHCAELDECTVGDNVCGSPDRQCTNTPGSFSCSCGAGYTTTTQRNCQDIDECTVYGPREICPFMTNCINTVGSYICQCMEPGFVGDGKQCVDIDECAIGNYTCGDNAVCVNALGSYACFCADGYTGRNSRDGKEQCSDINECESDTKRCSRNAECVNIEGSYQCICKQGYEVRGAECRDIDECASGEAECKQDSQCVNVPGSYACQCKLGYHLTGDLCQDINECQQNLAECHHRADCYNTDGSYLCVCKSGFYGDGYYCTSSAECEKNHHACYDAVQGKEEHTEEHDEHLHETP